MSLIGAALIGGIAGLAGQAWSGSSARGERYRQQEWSKEMSDSSHQRQVADMRLAGLNPMLSATGGGGASTPTSAQASVPDYSESAQKAVSSALAMKDLKVGTAQEKLLNNQSEVATAVKSKEESATKLNKANELLTQTRAIREGNQAHLEREQTANEYKLERDYGNYIRMGQGLQRATGASAKDIYEMLPIGKLGTMIKDLMKKGPKVPANKSGSGLKIKGVK